jgi:hypothetical protein
LKIEEGLQNSAHQDVGYDNMITGCGGQLYRTGKNNL